jgi:hypothetical protein
MNLNNGGKSMLDKVIDKFKYLLLPSDTEAAISKIFFPAFNAFSHTKFLCCSNCGSKLPPDEHKSISVNVITLKSDEEKVVGFVTYIMCIPCLVELGHNPGNKLFDSEIKPDEPTGRKED